MAVIIEYVPAGLESSGNIFLHEVIEDFLYDNWTDSDPVPRNNIRFSYKVDQNVSISAKNALKCYDAGSTNESMVTNDSAEIHYTNIAIEIETRSINNLQNDIPIELYKMKKKIMNVINGDKTALRSIGIHLMNVEGNDTIERDEKNPTIYRMKLNCKVTQFMDRKITVV